MKAFEKWLDEGHICKPEHYMLLLRKVKGAEATWRAALEWVKREAISSDERGDISRDIINRELENK